LDQIAAAISSYTGYSAFTVFGLAGGFILAMAMLALTRGCILRERVGFVVAAFFFGFLVTTMGMGVVIHAVQIATGETGVYAGELD
jgi:hypothetical protein